MEQSSRVARIKPTIPPKNVLGFIITLHFSDRYFRRFRVPQRVGAYVIRNDNKAGLTQLNLFTPYLSEEIALSPPCIFSPLPRARGLGGIASV